MGGKGGEGSFELVEVVRWANEGKVVSVDSACGTDHDTGSSFLPSFPTSFKFGV